MRSAIIAMLLVFFATAAVAETVTTTTLPAAAARGRVYFASPSHYTSTLSEFAIEFRDDLPFGSQVRVHYGFGGETTIYDSTGPRQVPVSWEGITDVEAHATEDCAWEARFRATLHERGLPRKLTYLQFVFAVRLPDGREYYVKGSDSRLGYYEVQLPNASSTADGTPVASLAVKPVRKD